MAHIIGTNGNDSLEGTDENDSIEGLLGNDTIHGRDGDDVILGGEGNDRVFGEDGNDSLEGGAGNDALTSGLGDDVLIGGDGNDRLTNGSSFTSYGADTMMGGAGDDVYVVVGGYETIVELAGEGHDVVYSVGSHTLADNVEDLYYGVFTDTPAVGIGNDLANTLGLLGDNDDADRIELYGLGGNDTIFNENTGHSGFLADGGEGDDLLQSNGMPDTLVGGSGVDRFEMRVTGAIEPWRYPMIQDFEADTERIGLLESDRLPLRNTLTADMFHIGAEAQSAAHHYLYHDDALWYDPDGVGGAEQLRLFTLIVANGTLDAGDFYVVPIPGTGSIDGSAGNDSLAGTAGAEEIAGLAGKDTINAGQGDDQVFGGDGADRISGQGGDDALFGEAGNDWLNGNAGNDTLYGAEGTDKLYGRGGHDYLDGGVGADTMEGGEGFDTYVVDDPGDVVLDEGNEVGIRDTVYASIDWTMGGGIEALILTGAADLSGTGDGEDNDIRGNTGDNLLSGLGGVDTLRGDAGNDTLLGGSSGDFLYDGEGDDSLNGGGGDDVLQSEAGDDVLAGGAGNDSLYSFSGDDTLRGGDGNDLLANASTMNGGAGDDTIRGGLNDVMTGSSGDDDFHFGNKEANTARITDFDGNADELNLSRFGFNQPAGDLAANQFHAGTSATTADQRFIYDESTGALYYDPDGTGAAEQVNFLTVTVTDGVFNHEDINIV